MPDPEFVHLHVHSEYSMLDSAIRLKALAKRVAELGQRAVALTDHHNMHGTVQFVAACKEYGVRPIVGCEVNLSAAPRHENRPVHHLVLLAASQRGYANLVRLVSLGWVEGLHHGVPRIDLELLAQHREGLVGLTGCMGGYVAQEILLKGEEAGRRALGLLRDALEPGALYVELQDHGFPENSPLNDILVELARSLRLPLVATNDCHYLERNDARAQLVLQCIGAGRALADMERAHHGSHELYVKSSAEMAELFRHLPEALRSTLQIAERCAGQCELHGHAKLPRFPVPSGMSEAEYLRERARAMLEVRQAEAEARGRVIDRRAYRERLEFELATIIQMGFSGYFLIVQDFINWAKDHGIPVGPGRGSGAGSLVAYALRITDLDPIEHGLLFERFLNPERISMPDFDIDFCMERRDEVIEYVRTKYGSESVGQIATFHQLKPRSVVKDVGRVLQMQLAETQRIASLVPDPVGGKTVSIAQAIEQESKLKASYEEDPRIRELLDTAMALEDLTRHAGMHAAGIVISEGPLWDHVPVFCPEPGIYVTQYDKDDVEHAGLVKFDFLGLKTLTVIDYAVRWINRRPDRNGNPFRLDRIPMDDPATFALLQSGETTNVFQLESQGMQSLFKKLRPDTFEDIVAAVALYRPGPLGSGMVEDFVQRKHGRVKVEYPDPCLESILKDTYGVIVYQEQVMEIARTMAGYTLGSADLLRRAMGKKKPEEMAKQRAAFIAGAQKNGHSAEKAAHIFDLVDHFAGYGFNKSHSAAYALITYQTAYLKAHYPVEFICATLTADKDKIDKVVRTVAEARAMGITVLPPDVNESAIDFTVVYDPPATGNADVVPRRHPDKPVSMGGVLRDDMRPKIRFGLGGVKGIGSSALEAIFEARKGPDGREEPFTDLFDFASRVDLRRVNKSVLEALVQSGAFDSVHEKLGVSRAQAFAAIDAALERGKRASQDRARGQTSLFGLFDTALLKAAERTGSAAFPTVTPWDTRELLARERAALGFYVSGHPLDRFRAELERFGNATTASLGEHADGAEIRIGGTVEGWRERSTKTGGKIGFFYLEDAHGRVEVTVREREFERAREVLTSGEPIFLDARLRWEHSRDTSEDDEAAPPEPKLTLQSVRPLSQALRERTKAVRVRIAVERLDGRKLRSLRDALRAHPGPCPVGLELTSSEAWSVSVADTGLSVEPSDALMASLERIFGEKVLELR